MTRGIFKLRLSDGSERVAVGDTETGPKRLLEDVVDLDDLIRSGDVTLGTAPNDEPIPPDARVMAPVGSQEVWAAGVTYLRSREARVEEARDPTPYDLVYDAQRPEVFFKSPGWRVRGPGEPIAVRSDSKWNAPEPELALVLDPAMRVIGFTIGNDVSSRSIEGDNPLYLPQAKVYDGSCSLGPCIVPATEQQPPFAVRMQILREGDVVFAGQTNTERMKRSFADLAEWLGRALSFPTGAVLLTGTGIVPEADFTLRPGDVVHIEIEGLGRLENPVVTVGAGT